MHHINTFYDFYRTYSAQPFLFNFGSDVLMPCARLSCFIVNFRMQGMQLIHTYVSILHSHLEQLILSCSLHKLRLSDNGLLANVPAKNAL